MNKKFLSAILFGALMVTSTGTFVSCKDYDDDIDGINKELTEIKSQIAALQGKIEAGKWITSVTPATGGFTVTFSDGSNYTITNGKDGQDGAAGAAGAAGTQWTISADGYWECDGVKTEVKAVGQDGAQGEAGKDAQPEVKFEDGKWFLWNGTEFVEFKGAETPAANVPYCYEDPTDPNYTILVAYTQDGVENKIRLPRTSGLGQIVVLDNSNKLTLRYHTFNGVHKSGKNATWAWESEDGSAKAKALPENGKYMLTASSDAYYVQVVPANYDISQLSFKLVNSKGDEAPVKLGAPVPCTVAVSRANASESGVYAIPFELKEMTKEVLDDYRKNIEGKALSLVATESVRSTYTSALEVKEGSNAFAEFDGKDITEEELGESVTITPKAGMESYVYDSYLTMDASSKADSVRYGVKLAGMTITYNKDIKKGTVMKFVVNQLNSKAMLQPTAPVVTVTFAKPVENKTEFTYDEQKHDAVANLTINNKKQDLQYIDVPFADFLNAVAKEDGDKLMWYQDVKGSEHKVVWTPVDENGNLMDEADVTSLIDKVQLLDKDKETTTDYSKVVTMRLHFKANYPYVNLGNGNFIASVTFKKENGDLNVAHIPFVLNNPTKETIASWYAWDKENFVNGTLTVSVANNTSAQSINLSEKFSAQNASGAALNMFIKEGKKKEAKWYTPNMSISGYPYTALNVAGTDDAKKAAQAEARKKMTWTGYSSYINATGDGSGSKSDLETNLTDYLATAQLTIAEKADKAYYNNAYTIGGMYVTNLGKGVKYDADNKKWVDGEDRTFAIDNIKLVIMNKSQSNREDQISFSKALQIAVNLDGYTEGNKTYYGYIRLSNKAFTPIAGNFFGTFTLADYAGNAYEVASDANVKVYEKVGNAYATAESKDLKVAIEKYSYKVGNATQETAGLTFKYLQKEDFTAGKKYDVKLVISKATVDGHGKANVTVYATITVGGI